MAKTIQEIHSHPYVIKFGVNVELEIISPAESYPQSAFHQHRVLYFAKSN